MSANYSTESLKLKLGMLLNDTKIDTKIDHYTRETGISQPKIDLLLAYGTDPTQLLIGKMNGTQESIQVTSYWFIFHSKHARESVKTWAEHV